MHHQRKVEVELKGRGVHSDLLLIALFVLLLFIFTSSLLYCALPLIDGGLIIVVLAFLLLSGRYVLDELEVPLHVSMVCDVIGLQRRGAALCVALVPVHLSQRLLRETDLRPVDIIEELEVVFAVEGEGVFEETRRDELPLRIVLHPCTLRLAHAQYLQLPLLLCAIPLYRVYMVRGPCTLTSIERRGGVFLCVYDLLH